eukprot:8967888-Lingulodinium_polyedra.AAC.1
MSAIAAAGYLNFARLPHTTFKPPQPHRNRNRRRPVNGQPSWASAPEEHAGGHRARGIWPLCVLTSPPWQT